MKLPKLYEHFPMGRIFSIEEARLRLGTTGNTLRKRLSELSARGYIQPVRQGLYRVCPPTRDTEARNNFPSCSPYAIAARLTPQCYLGFGSALDFHAGLEPGVPGNLYVVSGTKFNSFVFEGRRFVWCQGPEELGVEKRSLADDTISLRVTSIEKTLVDCLRRPIYCPALSDLLARAARLPRPPDTDVLLHIVRGYGIAALFNRLGLFLELMQGHWEISRVYLNGLQCLASRKTSEWPTQKALDAKDSEGMGKKSSSTLPPIQLRNRWRVQFPDGGEDMTAMTSPQQFLFDP